MGLTFSLEICLPRVKDAQEETWAGVTEQPLYYFVASMVLIELSAHRLSSDFILYRWQPGIVLEVHEL